MERIAWGILGAGSIAKTFAKGLRDSQTGTLLAVGSRDLKKAQAFAAELGAPRGYGSYEDLLADKDVQAVYIATPHPMHALWAIRAAEAGKHILCEKPIAMNAWQTQAIIEAARRNDVFLMEAFMYRCHEQIRRVLELIRTGAIGQVRLIRANFAFNATFKPESRLFDNALGGGGILDVGCYCASMARLIAGAALGQDGVAEPLALTGYGHLGQTGVDEWAIASAKFPGDIVAQLATGVHLNLDNNVAIFGSEGNLVVESPWIPSREGGTVKLVLTRYGQGTETIEVSTKAHLYSFEADMVGRCLANRQAVPPAMTWEDTLGNMRMLDMWREAIGLVYEEEKPGHVAPAAGRQPRMRPGHKMLYGKIAGVDKPVSRLVMGVDNQRNSSHACHLFDEYFESSGNTFDTAHIYGGGNSETLLGEWVRTRGLREQVVILDKGAHTPFCTPADLTRQLAISLERLGMDHVDIYMMHRDNEDVPVGEFVEVLNEHLKAGRIKAFGGSNWTRERFIAFNDYAAKHSLRGFAALSNNFSLARMVAPPWKGCLACSDEAWRKWLKANHIAVMPWSSQARGFFARGNPKDTSDAELVACWYAPDNFERQHRAQELAKDKGVDATTVALAYVLAQPFPTFPLIGPRSMAELGSSFRALELKLTKEEVAWLNLEA